MVISEQCNLFIYSTTMNLIAWGNNSHGQCDVPVPNTDFMAVVAGSGHTLGLKVDNSIVAWGAGQSGQSGYPHYGQCDVPVPNTDFAAISAGWHHSLGLKIDKSIVAWGLNDYDQAVAPSGTDFVAISAGYTHNLGLKSDGSISGWGLNSNGQCNVPAPNTDFIAVAGGGWHSLGLKTDGSIVAWGRNYSNQCDVPSPNTDFVTVAAGSAHSLGLKANGSIVAWGRNDFGQATAPSGTDFVAIAGGRFHSLGLKVDGSIVAWGSNGSGQCDVPLPNVNFDTIAAGFSHSLGSRSAFATSRDLFTYGHDIFQASGDLFIHNYNDISEQCNLFTYGHNPLYLYINGFEITPPSSILAQSLDWLLKTSDYYPQIIGTFNASASGVNIQVWDITDGQNIAMSLASSGCYAIGDTGRWGWSTANLPIIYGRSRQYFYVMTSVANRTFSGQFIINMPEDAKWIYPRNQNEYIK